METRTLRRLEADNSANRLWLSALGSRLQAKVSGYRIPDFGLRNREIEPKTLLSFLIRGYYASEVLLLSALLAQGALLCRVDSIGFCLFWARAWRRQADTSAGLTLYTCNLVL